MGIQRVSSRLYWLGPRGLFWLCAAIYGVPALFQFILSDTLFRAFYPVANDRPMEYVAVMVVGLTVVWGAIRLVPTTELGSAKLLSERTFSLVIRLHLLVVVVLNVVAIQYYDLYAAGLDFLQASSMEQLTQRMALFGYTIAYEKRLFLYSVLYFSPAFFLLVALDDRLERLVRALAILGLSISITALLICGRREFLAYFLHFALALAVRNRRKFYVMALLGIAPVVLGMAFLVLVRLKASEFSLSAYLESQEFYAFSFGAYATLSGKAPDSAEMYASLVPLSSFLGVHNLSQAVRGALFAYWERGPVVSMIYTTLRCFPVGLLLFAVSVWAAKWVAGAFRRAVVSGDVRQLRVGAYVYSFVMVKFFILIRNGETGLFLTDALFFLVLNSPVLLAAASTKFGSQGRGSLVQ